MRAITVHGLWAWAIVHGHKRVENRKQAVRKFRGELAIHAGQSRDSDAHARDVLESLGVACPTDEELDDLRGKVIGACLLVACEAVEDYKRVNGVTPLAVGPHCLVLERPTVLRDPVPCIGQLSLWHLPDAVEQSVRAQLGSGAWAGAAT